MAYSKLDPSAWNLTISLGVLATAATTGCGPKVPFESDTDTGETTSGTSGPWTTDPTAPTDPTLTTTSPPPPTATATDTSAECFSDDDCPYYYYCYNNRCYYDDYCADGCCDGGCYYDCSVHEDCGPDAYCYYGSCSVPLEAEPCPDIVVTPIPLPDTGSEGALSLAFVDAEANGDDELVQGRAGAFEVDFVGTQALSFSLGASTVSSIATGEFTGDDIVDLVVGDQPASALLTLRGVGNGAFPFQAINSASPADHPVVTGDFDGDGLTDVVSRDDESSAVLLYSGLGDGSFGPGQPVIEGVQPTFAAGDFNRDGISDLVVHSLEFTELWLGGPSFPMDVLSVPESAGTASRMLATGDFNGDGLTDAVGVSPAGLITFWEGNGFDFSWPPRHFAILPGMERVAVGDINGDGNDDLLATSEAAETLFVYRGGANSMLVSCSLAVGVDHPASALAVGDVDGDGADDVAYANETSTTVWSLTP